MDRRQLLKTLGAGIAAVPGMAGILNGMDEADESVEPVELSDLEASIEAVVTDIIDEFGPGAYRDDVIERLDEVCDEWFGDNVKYARIDEYDVADMLETAPACVEIIEYAGRVAWVEDDWGLWDGLTYGVLASVAFFSLRNTLYQLLADKGYDTNDDYPFGEADLISEDCRDWLERLWGSNQRKQTEIAIENTRRIREHLGEI